jgi:hypothetical protein
MQNTTNEVQYSGLCDGEKLEEKTSNSEDKDSNTEKSDSEDKYIKGEQSDSGNIHASDETCIENFE